MLTLIKQHQAAQHFLEPVDPVRMNCPDYFDIVQEPMDISTLEKMDVSDEEFVHWFMKMVQNACQYNPKEHNTLFPDIQVDWSRYALQIEQKRRLTKYPSDKESDEDKKKKKKKKKEASTVPKVCEYCSTTETPMWRRGPSGKSSLCNKCGVKWRSGRILKFPDGSILRPPSPNTLSRPIKASKNNPRPVTLKQSGKITYAQKRHLANMLSMGIVPQHHLAHIIHLIRQSMPNLKSAQEEIELDIEAMDAKLVQELWLYVTQVVGMKPADEDFGSPLLQ
ncbi:hypothetical protein EDD86DRAFT_243548 [Gorgonomyces haynaldii]|nr:hypothetical protein EDD86DRAFT_243548 [Gorgonomyces haynaldii]